MCPFQLIILNQEIISLKKKSTKKAKKWTKQNQSFPLPGVHPFLSVMSSGITKDGIKFFPFPK